RSYSFKYSPRPGTPAAEMTETIDSKVMHERLARLQSVIDDQQAAFNRSFVGRTVEVLFERPARKAGQLVGRSPWLQPVHVMAAPDIIGTVRSVALAGLERYSFLGSLSESFNRGLPNRQRVAPARAMHGA